MELTRRSVLVYGVLVALWLLVAGWQTHEHFRVRDTARASLRSRSIDIANTLSAFIRGLRFRGAVLQDRLEPVLNELVNASSNEIVKASELISIVLLNASNEPVASAGRPIDLNQAEIMQAGERWGRTSLTIVNPVDLGAILTGEGATNPTVVLPPFQSLTNAPRVTNRETASPAPLPAPRRQVIGRSLPRPALAGRIPLSAVPSGTTVPVVHPGCGTCPRRSMRR